MRTMSVVRTWEADGLGLGFLRDEKLAAVVRSVDSAQLELRRLNPQTGAQESFPFVGDGRQPWRMLPGPRADEVYLTTHGRASRFVE